MSAQIGTQRDSGVLSIRFSARSKSDLAFASEKPIVWSEYPALVFSGSTASLGEIPCEPTANVPFKFAMVDPRCAAADDFARSPGMALPLWPDSRVQPVEGVCFVLADGGHPALRALLDQGAVEGEHFVLADAVCRQSADAIRRVRLSNFVAQLGGDGPLLMLGFGDQGKKIAALLRDECNVPASRIHVMDSGEDSRRSARSNGHAVLLDCDALATAAAVIYSPEMRYAGLYSLVEQALRLELAVFDNSSGISGREQLRQSGIVWLDAATARAIDVRGTCICPKPHGLRLDVNIVREDRRLLHGVELQQLTSGHSAALHDSNAQFDLGPSSPNDRLAPSTFRGLSRAYLSIIRTPALAVFAARALCEQFWPEATASAFPAHHECDLGSTRFQRLLKRHIGGAEIIMASQCSTQQVMLGVAAQHYAADSPIVEIGSALGGSGAIMAAATDVHRPPFYSIDPDTATRHVMRWAFQQQDQLERLQQLIDTSDRAIHQLAHLREKAGLVFIDGLHTADAMLNDFINYAPLVRRGGALLIHDVEPARYSVMRVVLEKVLTDKRFEPQCLVDGLLVLERRGI